MCPFYCCKSTFCISRHGNNTLNTPRFKPASLEGIKDGFAEKAGSTYD